MEANVLSTNNGKEATDVERKDLQERSKGGENKDGSVPSLTTMNQKMRKKAFGREKGGPGKVKAMGRLN